MWLGFVLGYLCATIVGVILEGICILIDKKELDKWVKKERK